MIYKNDRQSLKYCSPLIWLNGALIPGVNMVLSASTKSSIFLFSSLVEALRGMDKQAIYCNLTLSVTATKRSVQIAFALSSLAENLLLKTTYGFSLCDNFSALGLSDCMREIGIDDLNGKKSLNISTRKISTASSI